MAEAGKWGLKVAEKEIPVGSFFDSATVAQLADLIETLRWAGNQSSA